MPNYNELVKKYQTPIYLFDINNLINRVNYLKDHLSSNRNLVYAVKANNFIAKELVSEVSRYEICSKGEFDVCNNLGVPRDKMVISGVYKDRPSIEEMISKYDDILKYTIESMNQYNLLKELSKKYNRNIHILIRLTSGNQFGVTEEEFIEIIKDKQETIEIDGIEYFSGTQKHSLKKVTKEVDYIKDFITRIEQELDFKINEVEYGPGSPVFYFQDDEFDEEAYLKELDNQLSKFEDKNIYIELGRSIAASCGSYITSVVDMKYNKNGNIVILDGGINHLTYYGQTMAMRIPYYKIFPERTERDIINYNLYGSLCTINDIIVKNININELELGDIFVFENTGAYCSTEGISLFLSRDLPKGILYSKEKEFIVVRETIKTSDINYPNY